MNYLNRVFVVQCFAPGPRCTAQCTEKPIWFSNKLGPCLVLESAPPRGHRITEVVGLQSKCYSYVSQSDVKKVKKGFPRRQYSDMNFSLYKKALQKGNAIQNTSVSIDSKKQILETCRKHALNLTNLDTKRYILDCKVHSYGFGHENISLFKGKCLKCNKK